MTQLSGQTSEFTGLSSHLHLGLESCPTCGQQIPPDKLEEISGKIAARQREHVLAITAQLENRYESEKAIADAKAKTELESERQQSAVRESRVRDAAQKAAEKFIAEKQAEAEQARRELVAGWQQQLAAAESAQKSAEQTWANLQADVNELRATNATAIETIKAEAKEREKEIRDEATRSAESAAAERIAAIETAQRESDVELKARISEAETARIALEQNQSRLTSELDALRNCNETELTRVREEAAAELLRVRRVATEEAEARFRDNLKANEGAVAEANTKAREAEAKLLILTDQHTSAMETSLKTQREILERAKEDAVNAEKARAFEENQRLSNKVTEMQRALENKTAEELGEGAEVNLFEALKKEFPEDDIRRVPKGTQAPTFSTS